MSQEFSSFTLHNIHFTINSTLCFCGRISRFGNAANWGRLCGFPSYKTALLVFTVWPPSSAWQTCCVGGLYKPKRMHICPNIPGSCDDSVFHPRVPETCNFLGWVGWFVAPARSDVTCRALFLATASQPVTWVEECLSTKCVYQVLCFNYFRLRNEISPLSSWFPSQRGPASAGSEKARERSLSKINETSLGLVTTVTHCAGFMPSMKASALSSILMSNDFVPPQRDNLSVGKLAICTYIQLPNSCSASIDIFLHCSEPLLSIFLGLVW